MHFKFITGHVQCIVQLCVGLKCENGQREHRRQQQEREQTSSSKPHLTSFLAAANICAASGAALAAAAAAAAAAAKAIMEGGQRRQPCQKDSAGEEAGQGGSPAGGGGSVAACGLPGRQVRPLGPLLTFSSLLSVLALPLVGFVKQNVARVAHQAADEGGAPQRRPHRSARGGDLVRWLGGRLGVWGSGRDC